MKCHNCNSYYCGYCFKKSPKIASKACKDWKNFNSEDYAELKMKYSHLVY